MFQLGLMSVQNHYLPIPPSLNVLLVQYKKCSKNDMKEMEMNVNTRKMTFIIREFLLGGRGL